MFLGNSKGGRTQYMLNTWQHIDHNRFHFDFLTLCDALDYEQVLLSTGAYVFHISCYAEDNPEQFRKEMMEIFQNGYDAIHVHFSFWRGFLIEECAKKAQIPKIILHSHNNGISMVADEHEVKLLEKEHFRLRKLIDVGIATHFLACSKVAAEWMYSDMIPVDRVKIVRNGIDINKFRYNAQLRDKKREELGVKDYFVIGCIAKFNYQKNHDFLIDVFAKVEKLRGDIVLILVGVGELQPKIEAKVKELGLEKKVVFLGKRDDVPELLQAIDLFALPSRFEGFALAFMEAQTAELPCVVGNVPEENCLTDRAHRLPLNVGTWVDVIVDEIDKNSRNHVSKEILALYDIKKQVSSLEEIYEE